MFRVDVPPVRVIAFGADRPEENILLKPEDNAIHSVVESDTKQLTSHKTPQSSNSPGSHLVCNLTPLTSHFSLPSETAKLVGEV